MQSVRDLTRLGYVSRLVDIRTTSPDFRMTGRVKAVLVAVVAAAGVLAGSVLVLLDAIAPAMLSLTGDQEGTILAVFRLVAAAYAIHAVLSTAGASARGLSTPADAKILGHAGYTRADVFLTREIVPAVLGALGVLAGLTLFAALASLRWGPSWSVIGADYGLAVALVIGALLLRFGLMARFSSLRRGPALPLQIGVVVASFVVGVVTGGFLLPMYLEGISLVQVSSVVIDWLISGPNSWALWAGAGAAAAVGSVLLVLSYDSTWNETVDAIDSPPEKRDLRLPRKAWARLVALPVVAWRETHRSDAFELVMAQRVGLSVGAFGLGVASFGRAGLDLPAELAVGLLFGVPVTSAGVLFGVTSLPALRGLLPVLSSSRLGSRGVSSAVAVASVWSLATVSWGTVPIVLTFSDLPAGAVLAVWASGVLVSPGVFHTADSLLPTRATTGSSERIRQGTPASLLVALLALLLGLGAWAALRVDLPVLVLIVAAAAVTTVAVLALRPPIGGYR